jgi:hypothetical protein
LGKLLWNFIFKSFCDLVWNIKFFSLTFSVNIGNFYEFWDTTPT